MATMAHKPVTRQRSGEQSRRSKDPIVRSFADLSYLAYTRLTPRPFVQFVSGHYPPATIARPHSHPCVALHGCLQGTLVLVTPQGRIPLEAGAFCLLAPNIEHQWQNEDPNTGATLGLLIDTEHPGRWPRRSGVAECCRKLAELVQGVRRLDVAKDDELGRSFWLVADHLISAEPCESAGTVGALLSLVSRCLMQLEGRSNSPSATTDLAQRIRRLLLSRVSDRLRIRDVAREFSVSPTSAKEAFRKTFGSGIIAYHNQLKIWQAKRWLCDRSLTVEQVSNKLGFSIPSYFSQVFLQHTGETPTDFRQKHRAGSV